MLVPLRVLEQLELSPLVEGFIRVRALQTATIVDRGRELGDVFDLVDGITALFEAADLSR